MVREALLCVAVAALTPPAMAARKAKTEPLAAVEVAISNTCETPLALSLGGNALTVPAGGSATAPPLQPKAAGEVFSLTTQATPPVELARLAFSSGPKQTITVERCRGGRADVLSQPTELPSGVSPLATTQVRFRSRHAAAVLEYAVGATGAFKPLSVAMTSYASNPPGDLPFSVRLRAAKGGPIMATAKKTVKLSPDRRYLVEVEMVGAELVSSVEDEGKAELP